MGEQVMLSSSKIKRGRPLTYEQQKKKLKQSRNSLWFVTGAVTSPSHILICKVEINYGSLEL